MFMEYSCWTPRPPNPGECEVIKLRGCSSDYLTNRKQNLESKLTELSESMGQSLTKLAIQDLKYSLWAPNGSMDDGIAKRGTIYGFLGGAACTMFALDKTDSLCISGVVLITGSFVFGLIGIMPGYLISSLQAEIGVAIVNRRLNKQSTENKKLIEDYKCTLKEIKQIEYVEKNPLT